MALFVAFSPYEWICKIISYYHNPSASCNLRHGVVTLVALGFFFLSILASKEFKLLDMISMKRQSV